MPEQTTILTPAKNPFDDANSIEKSYQPDTININPVPRGTPEPEPPAATPSVPITTKDDEEVFDETEYLKNAGFKSIDEIKAAREELEQLRNKKPEIKYGIPDDKQEEYYNILDKKIKLERAEKLDPTNTVNASQIVRTALQYANPDLTTDEIDYLYDKKYSVPDKPKKVDFTDDDEFNAATATWEKQSNIAQKELVIDAKMAKPRLAEYKKNISLPDIPVPQNQPSQEELQAAEQARQAYFDSIEPGLKAFSGYNTTFKDGDADVPLNYAISDDEKKALDATLRNFDIIPYFQNRWLDKEGKFKTDQIASDLYLLENPGKVLTKMVNEAANQKEKAIRKTTANINVNGSGKTNISTQQPNPLDKQVEYLFKNG
jgi:hypothetical protein